MSGLLFFSVSNRHHTCFRSLGKHLCLRLVSVVNDVYFLYTGTKFHMLLCIAGAEAPQFYSGKVTEGGCSFYVTDLEMVGLIREVQIRFVRTGCARIASWQFLPYLRGSRGMKVMYSCR